MTPIDSFIAAIFLLCLIIIGLIITVLTVGVIILGVLWCLCKVCEAIDSVCFPPTYLEVLKGITIKMNADQKKTG